MYAIFRAKGKQFRAEPETSLRMPSLDAEPGETIVFDDVLLAERDGEVLVGRPSLSGAAVEAEVVRHGKGEKIIVFKFKRRKNYRRKQGHRQKFTEVRITGIDLEDVVVEEPEEAAAPAGDGEPEAESAAEPKARREMPEPEPVGEEAEEALAEPEAEVAEVEALPEEEVPEPAEVEEVEAAEPEAVEEEAVEEEADEEPEADAEPDAEAEVDITNAARELAEEHDLDLSAIEGTGKDGRILKGDVQKAIKEQEG